MKVEIKVTKGRNKGKLSQWLNKGFDDCETNEDKKAFNRKNETHQSICHYILYRFKITLWSH